MQTETVFCNLITLCEAFLLISTHNIHSKLTSVLLMRKQSQRQFPLSCQAVIGIAVHTFRQKMESNTKRSLQYVSGLHMWCSCTHGLSIYSDTEGCFIWLQHKAVAQAVWKPEKYKETSHTTCCHYDNQAESFSLISCHSTQHRNPIAFKSYATRPMIRSARLLTHLQIRFIGAYMDFLVTF